MLRLVRGAEVEGVFTLFALAFVVMGVLMAGLGIVGEYVGRIYQQVRGRPRFPRADGTRTGGSATGRCDAWVNTYSPQNRQQYSPWWLRYIEPAQRGHLA